MEKPTAAFILLLIGGIFIIIGGIFVIALGGVIAGMELPAATSASGLVIGVGFLGLIFGILVVIGALMVNSGDPDKVKNGSIIGLIFGVLSLFVVGGGFFIGFLLSLIDGILGLTWKPGKTQVEQPAPT